MVVIDNLLINNINSSYIQNTLYESKLSPTEKDKYIELQKNLIEKNIISVPKKINKIPNPEYDIYMYNLFILKNILNT